MQTATHPLVTGSTGIRIKSILVPIDFSTASEKALDYALQISEAFGSNITLFHVVESLATPGFPDLPPASEEAEFSDSEKKLHQLAASIGDWGVNWKLTSGVAGHEIIEAAKEEDVDLIVMGTNGLTGWKHFSIGSTAERVARAACCPVLVVREKERKFI